MIPQGFIQDLLARADIVDVVGRAVQLKKAGINYKGLCPFHGEKSPSFIVSPSRQTYHCFGCGVHGNAVGFLMEHSGLGFVEAVKDLAQDVGMTVPDDDNSPEERARAAKVREHQITLGDVLLKASNHYRAQLKDSPRAVAYLKGRGLTGEIAKHFALGYAPGGWHGLSSAFGKYDDPLLVESGLVILQGDDAAEQRRYDRFRDRIMFPIRNPKGEVIGFGGRVLDQGEPKYLNSPETPVFSKGRELYGLFEARAAIRQRGFILVTEGYMDVVALAQLGFGNAVATLGTACTGEHIVKLLRFSEQVVFSFDGDAAGRRAAARALEAVLPHASDTRSFRFLFLPAEHDPDSFIRERGPEAFEACIHEAFTLSRQLLAVAGDGCDLASPEGRARMLAQARPLYELLPDGLLKAQLLVELARDGGLTADVLLHHWAAAGARRGDRRRAEPGHAEHQPHAAPAPAPRHHDEPDWDNAPPPDEAPPEADPNDLGYDPMDDGTPEHAKDWRSKRGKDFGGRGGKGRSFGNDPPPWARKGGSAAMASPRRPPPRTASLLDRAAWLMVQNAQLWLDLPGEVHELLVQQSAPHGGFFAALERLLHDQGVLGAAGILAALDELAQDPAEAGLGALLERIRRLHELGSDAPLADDLRVVVDRVRLQAVEDEITLLLESGELSEAATQRRNALFALRSQLKSRPARNATV
ncbi:DNA primase [Sphaerotilus montanus]|uniref:DNA primase n=1 Tax=Sphaerotilus montanus TaxID=522889 RepID=A0A7Y9QTZ3_9BURK|nr:DNA primase [Sphaerotilus montanus]NYG31251.1 DNA primase [Sphaerotilus montanus]NZD55237.1 DNA primase [Sphaerotilus montanus]